MSQQAARSYPERQRSNSPQVQRNLTNASIILLDTQETLTAQGLCTMRLSEQFTQALRSIQRIEKDVEATTA